MNPSKRITRNNRVLAALFWLALGYAVVVVAHQVLA